MKMPVFRFSFPKSRANRALLVFWGVILVAAATLVGTLQWLGPPPARVAAGVGTAGAGGVTAGQSGPMRPPAPAGPSNNLASNNLASNNLGLAAPPQHAPPLEPRRAGVPPRMRADIAPPDPALLEAAPGAQDPSLPPAMLPRIAADGRMARLVYAASVPTVPPGKRRVAILLDGVGLSIADSLDAIDTLPPAISLAVSPYAAEPDSVLEAARRHGHELLLSLPMEPARAPVDDEGTMALTDQLSPGENLQRLNWSLSRIQGYAGATNAFSGLNGENFASSMQMTDIARILGARGLFYVDATPGTMAPPGVASALVDVRLDDPPDAADIDRQLAHLEEIATSKGSAIGAAGPLYPVTVQRLADWTRTLPTRGLVLVPVSSLARTTQPPLPGYAR